MWRRWNRRVIGDAVIIYAPNFQKKSKNQFEFWILNWKFYQSIGFFRQSNKNVRIEKCSLWIVSVDNTVSMRSIHTRAILQQFQYTYVTESMFFSLFSSFAHFSLVAHCQSIRLRQATQPNAIHKMQRTATCHDINWIHELFICDSNVKTCFHFNVSAAEFLCGAGALGIIKCTLTNLITANCTPKWHVHCSAWFVVAFDMANISIYCKACMQDKDTYEQKKQKSIKQIANWLFFAQKKHNKKIVQSCSVCKYMLRNRFASSSVVTVCMRQHRNWIFHWLRRNWFAPRAIDGKLNNPKHFQFFVFVIGSVVPNRWIYLWNLYALREDVPFFLLLIHFYLIAHCSMLTLLISFK